MKKNRKKIVAFGCSHTYGQYLCDRSMFERSTKDKWRECPSEFAWPNQLCKLLYGDSYSLDNLASPGASLEFQLRRARAINLHNYDAALVLLPDFTRNAISAEPYTSLEDATDFRNTLQFISGFRSNTKSNRMFYKLHNNSELQYRWASSIDHLRALFQLCNVPYTISFLNCSDVPVYQCFTNSNVFEPLPDRPIFFDYSIDRARDYLHLGIKSNLKFAQTMYDNINTVGWTTK